MAQIHMLFNLHRSFLITWPAGNLDPYLVLLAAVLWRRCCGGGGGVCSVERWHVASSSLGVGGRRDHPAPVSQAIQHHGGFPLPVPA